ncbi:MAG: PAS domain S-box protein, partial [Halobacteriota archaeon]
MNNPPGTGGDRTPRSDGTDCPTLSVLLVADRAQVDRLASGLGGESVAVATETSPADALDRLESGGIDCVVSERRFPDADVVGFLRAVRDRFEAVPFVVWTDSGDEALASQAIAAGATDYLPRSADAPDYDRAVDRIRRAVSSPSHSVSDRGTAFDRISDAVHALDSSWRFTYLNDRAEELLGRTEAQLRGRYVWEAFPDAAVRSFKPEYERAMDTQEPVTFEEYSHAAESWLRVRAYPSDTGLTVYFRAVSDGRSSRLELFRTLVDHASDGFYVIDPHTSDILDVNETACRQLGYDRSELRSMSVPDINPAFSLDTWDDFVSEVRARGEKTVTGVHEAADGSTYPVEVEVSYVTLDRDYHVATVRDITDRKRRARKLEAARKRYRTLVEAAPDPIFVADVDTGRIVEANSAAAAIRNQPREEIVGLHQSALHPEAEGDRY